MTRRGAALAVVVAVVVTIAFCRPSSPGAVTYDRTGTSLLVGALMPRCGCLSVASMTDRSIELVGMLHGRETGHLRMEAGERHLAKVDWVGPEIDERYEISAYTVGDDGARGTRLEPISTQLRATWLDCDCRESVCAFGPLGLNAAYSAEQ